MSNAISSTAIDESPTTVSSLGGPTRVIVSTIAIFLISQLLAAFLVELGSSIWLSQSASQVLDYSAMAQLIFILLAEGLAVGSVLLILRRRRLSLKAIGWGRRLRWNDLWLALGGFAGFYILLIAVNLILAALIPAYNLNQTQDVGFNTISSGSDHLIALMALVILPPLGEETLMRGYLYSGLRSSLKFVPTLLITSGLFGAAHLLTGTNGLLWPAAVDTFVLSIVLVYLRERTGALYACVLVHALNNLVAFGIHFHG